MENATICGPCFAAKVMPSLPKRRRAYRRGICERCGKERALDSRGLCKSKCARVAAATKERG